MDINLLTLWNDLTQTTCLCTLWLEGGRRCIGLVIYRICYPTGVIYHLPVLTFSFIYQVLFILIHSSYMWFLFTYSNILISYYLKFHRLSSYYSFLMQLCVIGWSFFFFFFLKRKWYAGFIDGFLNIFFLKCKSKSLYKYIKYLCK